MSMIAEATLFVAGTKLSNLHHQLTFAAQAARRAADEVKARQWPSVAALVMHFLA